MKIIEVTYKHILFSNGWVITYDHEQDCCETNYADFTALETFAYEYNFKSLRFERCNGGFRFGDESYMVYVPCYSVQNGYYTTDIDIYLSGECVLHTSGEFVDECFME